MYAVIPAAGSGTRLQLLSKKQGKSLFSLNADGVSLLELTLRRIIAAQICRGFVVIVREQDFEQVKNLLSDICYGFDYCLVLGGETRQQSVLNGLRAIEDRAQYALVHDAARPFCPVEVFQSAAAEVKKTGAALVAVPVSSTLKRVNESSFIVSTEPRETIWMAQTPQVFRYDLLLEAYLRAEEEGFQGTDDCQLVERLGYQIKIVKGSELNIKITTPADIEMAKAILTLQN